MKHLALAMLIALSSPVLISTQAPADLKKLDAIEPLVKQASVEKKLPGAVVLSGRGERTIYQMAIGKRAGRRNC